MTNNKAPLFRRIAKIRRELDALWAAIEEPDLGVCEWCGKAFVRIRSTKRFCKRSCTVMASNRRRTRERLQSLADDSQEADHA